ncbi:protein MTSS 2-like isoform X2 [Dysidea avara]|uniref:protein MTSS 2-like isoform X2 n=1 Tax=Dysidea avara TaxID=196820 RepID=UPI003327CA6E
MGMLSMSYWSSVVFPSSPSLSDIYILLLVLGRVADTALYRNLVYRDTGVLRKIQTFNINLLTSMHGRLEEFHKSANTIEKECDRELKKSVNEAKEACTRTVKTSKNLAKKTTKEKFDEVQALKTELAKKQHEATNRIQFVYDLERRQLAKLLVEERAWYCTLIGNYMGVMNVGMSMVGEACPLAAVTSNFQDSL